MAILDSGLILENEDDWVMDMVDLAGDVWSEEQKVMRELAEEGLHISDYDDEYYDPANYDYEPEGADW